jgi:integrase
VARRFEHKAREIDAWTHDEASKLLDQAKEREPSVYAPLLCALHTGMRRGEVLGLMWEDIGTDRIRVRRALVRGHMTTTKSGKTREVPISPALRETLDQIRNDLNP